MPVPFFQPTLDHEEESALLETFRSGWISTGPKNAEFEAAFASIHGADHAVAVSNATAGLHLALLVHDIGPGDEVIVPSLSFVATASCVMMAGATPVFAEVTSFDDWTLSVDAVRQAMTSRTKAVIVMHYGGFGCDMKAFRALTGESGLVLIEDACHAILGEREGVRLGTASDAACYSFYSNKNLTTAEGGMILFKDSEKAARAKRLRSHGMTTSVYDREKGRSGYDVVEMGFNYRMDDLRAAIGKVQLQKLPGEIARRTAVAEKYTALLEGAHRFALPFRNYCGKAARHLFPILADSVEIRDETLARLKDAGIGFSVHYQPIHTFRPFRKFLNQPLPITESIAEREISLPFFGTLTDDQIQEVVNRLLDSR